MPEYFDIIRRLLAEVEERSGEAMRTASEWVAETIRRDRLVWVFGSGHAGVLADETFYRAGGLACVTPVHLAGLLTTDVPITDTTVRERTDGYARERAEALGIREGDVLIVHSVSGRNAAPVEVALLGKERGARVIALTGVTYAEASAPRGASGKRLHEVSDLVLDNRAPVGDAAVRIEGMEQPCSPVSTVLGAAILHSVFAEACRMLAAEGVEPPVFISANLEGGDERNQELLDRYRSRVTYL